MKAHRIVLLGPPAAGKGTQGEQMSRQWGLPITSTGEILRRETNLGTPMGVEAGEFTSLGKLVPDDLVVRSVDAWLQQNDASEFILDGSPRTLGQAAALDELFQRRGTPLTAVLLLEAGLPVIQDRVKHRVLCERCGRAFRIGWQVRDDKAACPVCGGALERRKDDDPETLSRRLAEYREKTESLILFYEARGLLHRINAEPPPDEVFAQITRALQVEEGHDPN